MDFFKHLLANLRIFLSIDIGTTQDDEPDLGQKLSPFGSTSSLQDLVEASSARASVDPNSQSSTSWIDKERWKNNNLNFGVFFEQILTYLKNSVNMANLGTFLWTKPLYIRPVITLSIF